MMRRLLPLFAILVVSCSSSSSDPPAKTDTGTPADTGTTPGLDVIVGGTGNVFTPATLTIKVGQTVKWTWAGSGHSVTSGNSGTCTGDGKFDSTVKSAGFTFTQKFDTAGTVDYFCNPHCADGMKAQIIVTP